MRKGHFGHPETLYEKSSEFRKDTELLEQSLRFPRILLLTNEQNEYCGYFLSCIMGNPIYKARQH